MSKKAEIHEFLSQGKSADEISTLGYNKNYVRRIEREKKKEELRKEKAYNEAEEIIDAQVELIKSIMKEVELQATRLLKAVENSGDSCLQTKVLDDLEEAEKFIRSLRADYGRVKNVQIQFTIAWGKEGEETQKPAIFEP